MSGEEDDVDWIIREINALSKRAKESGDSSVAMIEQLSARYEDRAAAKQIETRSREPAAVRWARRIFGRPRMHGSQALMAEAFANALAARGELSTQQLRVVVDHRVLQFSSDGGMRVRWPERDAFRRAAIMLVLLGAAGVIALVLAWEVFSANTVGWAICWTAGSLLGWLARKVYDSAWGRANIAESIRSRYWWLGSSGSSRQGS